MNTVETNLPLIIENEWPDAATFLEEQENKFTLVHCTYVSKPLYINGGWVNIWPTTYLVNSATDEMLVLQHALDVPLAPERFYFKKHGECKRFTLVFPAVPEHWESFHIKEKCGAKYGFTVNNLQRNSTGVYRVQFY